MSITGIGNTGVVHQAIWGSECGSAYTSNSYQDTGLTPWPTTVYPNWGTITLSGPINPTYSSYWISRIGFYFAVRTISDGFVPAAATYGVSITTGSGFIITQEGNCPTDGSVTWVYVGDTVITSSISLSCPYWPRIKAGTGFDRGWKVKYGNGLTPFFDPVNSVSTIGCPDSSSSGSYWYPSHVFYYDPNIKTGTPGLLDSLNTNMTPQSPTVTTTGSAWEKSFEEHEQYAVADALHNSLSGSDSDIYRVLPHTKATVLYTIASGGMDIKVSNDGTNFATYASVTSTGMTNVRGFKYVMLSVTSGMVNAASIAMSSSSPLFPDEDEGERHGTIYTGRYKSGNGFK